MRFALLLFCLLFSAPVATAHEWYEYVCCSDQDCTQTQAEHIKWEKGQYYILLGKTWEPIPQSVVRMKPHHAPKDGSYHICINQETGEMLCFYIPSGQV